MPTISRFHRIEIRMFFNEKHGPHFHAVHGEHRALIEIAKAKVSRDSCLLNYYAWLLNGQQNTIKNYCVIGNVLERISSSQMARSAILIWSNLFMVRSLSQFGRILNFSKLFVEGGTVAWPGEVDIAPETLYYGDDDPPWVKYDKAQELAAKRARTSHRSVNGKRPKAPASTRSQNKTKSQLRKRTVRKSKAR